MHELKLYIVHGLLHLHGFDDQTPTEARKMKMAQERILRHCCHVEPSETSVIFCLVSWKRFAEILRSAQDDNFVTGRCVDPPLRRFELGAAYVSVFPMIVEPLGAEVAGPLIAGTAILPKDAMPSTVGVPTIEKETDAEEALDLPWQVVVHNDPVNLMSYVTMVFQRVFGYPRDKAEKHMLEVHQKGRSILWSGMRERAELYVQQLHGYLLLATLEKIC